jgi:2-dehydropantoate 2-reductase
MTKRIAMVGTGANGSCIAADLTKAGLDVTIIDQWPAHVEAMRRDGLTITMPDEVLHTPVNAHHITDLRGMNTSFDVVFLVPKAYDTRWMTELIKPHLAADGLLIGIQNAMTVGDIASIVGPERTMGCVIELSSQLFEPAQVQRNTPPKGTWFAVGSTHSSTKGRESEITDILRHSGKVSISEDILSAKWMKLLINVMCLAPVAMTGKRVHEAFRLPGMRELSLRAGEEALEVGQRLGYKPEPIIGLSADEMANTNRLLEKLMDKITHDVGPRSMDCCLQDHIKGRFTETDMINGLVTAEAQRFGTRAPVNAAICEITRRITAGELKPDATNLELAQRLGGT